MKDVQYFVWKDEDSVGPYSRGELQQMVNIGHLKPRDIVHADGSVDWVPITTVCAERFESIGKQAEEASPKLASSSVQLPKRRSQSRLQSQLVQEPPVKKPFWPDWSAKVRTPPLPPLPAPLVEAGRVRWGMSSIFGIALVGGLGILLIQIPIVKQTLRDLFWSGHVYDVAPLTIALFIVSTLICIAACKFVSVCTCAAFRRTNLDMALAGIVAVDENYEPLSTWDALQHQFISLRHGGVLGVQLGEALARRQLMRGETPHYEKWRVVTVASLKAYHLSLLESQAEGPTFEHPQVEVASEA